MGDGLMKDKFIALFLIVILVAVLVLFRLYPAASAGVGFIENAILMVLGAFLALLKQTPAQTQSVQVEGDNTNVSTETPDVKKKIK